MGLNLAHSPHPQIIPCAAEYFKLRMYYHFNHFPKKPDALSAHQRELMKEHHVYYAPGYNGTVTNTQVWANDFGPAVVRLMKQPTCE